MRPSAATPTTTGPGWRSWTATTTRSSASGPKPKPEAPPWPSSWTSSTSWSTCGTPPGPSTPTPAGDCTAPKPSSSSGRYTAMAISTPTGTTTSPKNNDGSTKPATPTTPSHEPPPEVPSTEPHPYDLLVGRRPAAPSRVKGHVEELPSGAPALISASDRFDELGAVVAGRV